MKNALACSVKNLLDSSPLAAVIIDWNFRSVWYNNAYGKQYMPFQNIEGFSAKFPDIDINALKELVKKPSGSYISGGGVTLLKTNLKGSGTTMLSVIGGGYPEGADAGFYKNIFSAFYRPCLLFDYSTGAVKDTNKAFASLCGIPEEHIRLMSVRDLFKEGGDTISGYLSSGAPYLKPFIIHFTDAEDNKRFLEITPFLAQDDFVLFDMEDITSDVTYQVNDIRESFRYSFLYKNISDGIIIWKDRKIADINSAACRIWGYDKKEILGKDILTLFLYEPENLRNMNLYDGDDVNERTFRGVRKDGSVFDGEKVTNVFEFDGQKIYITVINDLTEHHKFLEMEREKKSIEETILNSQRNLVMVFDNSGTLVRCNEAFLKFFMCKDLNDFKNKFGTVERLFKDEHGFITESYGKFWFRKVAENEKIEYKLILKNQSDKQEHIFFVNSNNLAIDTMSYVVTLSDITETVQTALALKDANSLLVMYNENVKSEMETNLELLTQQTKLAMMGEMIGIITHQWKQPLNAMGLIAQNIEDILTEDEIMDREEIKSMTASIMKHVKAMGETVDNFRDFFKNSSVPKWFSLRKAIDSSMMLLQPVLKKSCVSVEVNMPEEYDGLLLRGSSNEFKQVLLNTVINAKDAIGAKISRGDAKHGSGKVIINVEKSSPEKVRITLKDNGTGLSGDDIANIFNMQYTTKGDAGTGIGMYMSNMIIEKMNGRIWADNWQEGAAIFIEVPAKDDTERKQ